MPMKIEDYGVIGDCETAALVGRDGSIDWLCWPNFASDACFAALLGSEENGRWLVAPADAAAGNWTTARRYLPHTLILETTWSRAGAVVVVTDFMPARTKHSHVVRKIECRQGQVEMRMQLSLRFDYGRSIPWVTREDTFLRAIAGPHLVVLRTPVETRGENQTTVANFSLAANESSWMTLSYGDSASAPPPSIAVDDSLEKAIRYWTRWAEKCTPAGDYSEAVERSLITLKALTYRPTGGVVAAVTTSIPESLGGERNWDYRYCWLRDSTFTLLALMNGGFYREAEAWQDWLLRAIAGSPDQIQIMYGIAGERQLLEWEVSWLSGYENSKPVRIGNAAAEQLQLDIYGEVMDAFSHAMVAFKRPRAVDLHLQESLIEHLRTIWQKPDQGIWESRSGPKQFTYSKMMVWVALDRAIAIAEQTGSNVNLEAWKALRQQVHEEICNRAWSKKLQAFTQQYDQDILDSSLLLMPLVGFLPATDTRIQTTIQAIEKNLMHNGFLLRYLAGESPDGLPQGEGAFLACSFWLVSCLKLVGRDKDARALLDRLLAVRNDLGLLSEEYDTDKQRQVGNFPQAFSHIALVNAVFDVASPESKRHLRHKGVGKVIAQNVSHASHTPELDPAQQSGAADPS
jgi:GH15 family glucan-1,4-alpha-glucosidase